MMLVQDIRSPAASEGPEVSLPAGLARALEAARETVAKSRREPWRVYPLDAEQSAALAWLAARRLEPSVGQEGARAAYQQWRAIPGWVVITCLRGDDEQQWERDLEAALSAAQRASLSLWSDNIPTNWRTDLVADDPEVIKLVGADPRREVPIGVLLYGHPDR